MTPYLAVRGAEAAIRFYAEAFHAKELQRQNSPDGKVLHSRLKIGDSIVMLSDLYGEGTGGAGTTRDGPFITLHMYLPNVDVVWADALKAGATVEMPLDDMFWGERYGQLLDPFGHHWSLSTPLKMSKARKDQLREEAMKQFGGSD
ncbi:MAG TPA: VOC family protein [Thermoplasmata archaeon]|nr:VOC family protein [Thermoplasmata archaeon]